MIGYFHVCMLWAMQSIAHGADYVSFFRWRTATVGTELSELQKYETKVYRL